MNSIVKLMGKARQMKEMMMELHVRTLDEIKQEEDHLEFLESCSESLKKHRGAIRATLGVKDPWESTKSHRGGMSSLHSYSLLNSISDVNISNRNNIAHVFTQQNLTSKTQSSGPEKSQSISSARIPEYSKRLHHGSFLKDKPPNSNNIQIITSDTGGYSLYKTKPDDFGITPTHSLTFKTHINPKMAALMKETKMERSDKLKLNKTESSLNNKSRSNIAIFETKPSPEMKPKSTRFKNSSSFKNPQENEPQNSPAEFRNQSRMGKEDQERLKSPGHGIRNPQDQPKINKIGSSIGFAHRIQMQTTPTSPSDVSPFEHDQSRISKHPQSTKETLESKTRLRTSNELLKFAKEVPGGSIECLVQRIGRLTSPKKGSRFGAKQVSSPENKDTNNTSSIAGGEIIKPKNHNIVFDRASHDSSPVYSMKYGTNQNLLKTDKR